MPNDEENACTDAQITTLKAIEALAGPAVRPLTQRLAALDGDGQRLAEDRILRVAGRLCLEFGQRELWTRLYREALAGCNVRPGDEMRFLLGGRPLNDD